ncbi:TlyA family RNA methyltransferase [Candidatus Microgenomates bacterium]|nr:TlyA family RNA methyltransferase [Candidatus Microgenomates bacterium]
MKIRLDKLLLDKGLVASCEKAQGLIMAGRVLVEGKVSDKPGMSYSEAIKIEILQTPQYVSRGAEKMAGAATAFALDFHGKIVADIGSSTGGFTDYALQNGAKKVYAIDVGTGQLDWSLRSNPKIVVMENTNARYLENLPDPIDIFVVDVSFISLKKILPTLKKIINHKSEIINHATIVVLFKPQFEAKKNIADKYKGVITDSKIHEELLADFRKWCEEASWKVLGECPSPINGDKGNREFFFYLKAEEKENKKAKNQENKIT